MSLTVAGQRLTGTGDARTVEPDQQPYATAVGTSPAKAEVPLWVNACVLFDPPSVNAADKVITAVTFLMASTVRVHGDLAVKLSPTRLALLCGFERPEKAKWLTDYLQKIGLLRIVDGGVNPKTGRRQARRDAKGRPIENEFLVFPEPPPHYCGPRTLAEIDALIAEDIAEAELAHERSASTGSKRSKPRTIPIRRRDLFVSAGQPTLLAGGLDSDTHPPCTGDGSADSSISAGQPTPPQGGMDFVATPPSTGDGHVSAGQPTLPPRGIYQIDRSSISGREIEGSIEPVAGGTAKPPATGLDEGAVADVRLLVRRLPWRTWAERRGVKFRLMEGDADVVQAAICEAMTTARITLDQAAEIGLAALGEAKSNPVGYVTDAFRTHLQRRLRALAVEPLAEDSLPLPGAAKPQLSTPKVGKQQVKGTPAAEPGSTVPKPLLLACSTCEAREGEGPGGRTVVGDDGRHRPCPDCRPA